MRLAVGIAVLAILATQAPHAQEASGTVPAAAAPIRLTPTAHPPLPGHPSQYWLVPDLSAARSATGRRTDPVVLANFVRALGLIKEEKFSAALPLIDGAALAGTPLGAYGYYYSGVALTALERYAEAESAFAAAAAQNPDGALREALPLRAADVAISRGDGRHAIETLDRLKGQKVTAPERLLLQVGRAQERAGDREAALRAYRQVYYDYPLSTEASDAQSGIERLQTTDLVPPDQFKQELSRAEKLFAAKRWAQSRAGFQPLARVAQGDEAELVALRLAEADYYLDRYRAAREALQPYLKGASREAEARFFYLTATAALGDQDAYVPLARRLVADFPDSPWAEETLNNLASYYIKTDQDDEADLVFRELVRRFPQSRYAERAAWKIGWRAYRAGDFREAATTFEKASVTFPRSDYRPSWLYWSARARDQAGESDVALSRFRLVIADYENTYYGRLASAVLTMRHEAPTAETVATAPIGAAPQQVPTDALIRQLCALQLFDDALREVQYAQQEWGNSPQLEATVAWIRHNQGLALSGSDRFNALRGAINTMKRAYPQYMAAGGENLPPEILRIIFPLDFWPLIARNSMQLDLDPYLIAALMAQESTFTPEIRSGANAWGLMQLLPSTAGRYARRMGIRRFSTGSLTDPEVNTRIGMQYFKDLVDRFGGSYFAIASYNAGENRIAQWRAEKPDLPQDEFIDDIPFPETQNYVKRILGTAEDYRRLYGGGLLDPNAPLLPGNTAVRPVKASSRKAAATKVTATKKVTSRKATSRKATPKKKPAAKKPARRRR